MPFVLKHKETGELWKGKNYKFPKYYAMRQFASSGLTNMLHKRGRIFEHAMGMPYEEYNKIVNEATAELNRQFDEAYNQYRHVCIDLPYGDPLRKEIESRMYKTRYALYRQKKKIEQKLREKYCKWEIVEV